MIVACFGVFSFFVCLFHICIASFPASCTIIVSVGPQVGVCLCVCACVWHPIPRIVPMPIVQFPLARAKETSCEKHVGSEKQTVVHRVLWKDCARISFNWWKKKREIKGKKKNNNENKEKTFDNGNVTNKPD